MKQPIHSHPKLEQSLGLDECHVIIDRELYYEMVILNSKMAIIASEHFRGKD